MEVLRREDVPTREQFHKVLHEQRQEPLWKGVEVGVQTGLYAEYLLEQCPGLLLFLVDPWEYQPSGYKDIANVPTDVHLNNLQMCRARLQRFASNARYLQAYSPKAAEEFFDEELDFVYLDGNHSYAATLADLKGWYPKLRKGGVMSGHDFLDSPNCCGSEFGVVSAVTEFVATELPNQGVFAPTVFATSEAWPTWWFIK